MGTFTSEADVQPELALRKVLRTHCPGLPCIYMFGWLVERVPDESPTPVEAPVHASAPVPIIVPNQTPTPVETSASVPAPASTPTRIPTPARSVPAPLARPPAWQNWCT